MSLYARLIKRFKKARFEWYDGKIGKESTFSWSGLTDPGYTPLTSCQKHAAKRIIWFNLFLRFVCFIVGIVINALDNKLGDAWQNPEKMIGVLICCYLLITFVYAILKEIPKVKEEWFDNNEVPVPLRFAWWCYDISLPGSFGTLILYFTMRQRHYEMTDGLYILNVVTMGLDMIGGRMVLIPGHFLVWYLIPVTFAGLYYKNHFGATVEQALVGWVVMCTCYFVLSFFTYGRAQCTGTMPITYSSLDLTDIGDDESINNIVDVEKITLKSESQLHEQSEMGGGNLNQSEKKSLVWFTKS